MSDQEDPQDEARQDSDPLKEARAAAKRNGERVKELEAENKELRDAGRAAALQRAGLDPETYTGKVVMAAVERDNITDPADIEALVSVVRAENQGA